MIGYTLQIPFQMIVQLIPEKKQTTESTVNGEERVDRVKQLAEQLNKTLKEGGRILVPTRRPDDTFRKSIRIRVGYTPHDEVAIYKSKGSFVIIAEARDAVTARGVVGLQSGDASKLKTKALKEE